MMCTGGTTGRPCGCAVASGRPIRGVDERRSTRTSTRSTRKCSTPGCRGSRCPRSCTPPACSPPSPESFNGQTAVLYDSTKFDPHRVLATIEREKVGLMTMVGDAYAVGLIDAIRSGEYDVDAVLGRQRRRPCSMSNTRKRSASCCPGDPGQRLRFHRNRQRRVRCE